MSVKKGRPAGSKDGVLRSNASRERQLEWELKNRGSRASRESREANEFMEPTMSTGTGEQEREQEPEDLASALKALRNDSEFIAGIVTRAKQGKLSPAEARAVMGMLGEPEPPKKREPWQMAWAIMTEPEQLIIADLLRRSQEYERTGVLPAARYDQVALDQIVQGR